MMSMARSIMDAFSLLPADTKGLLHLVSILLLLVHLVSLMFYRWSLSAHNFFWSSQVQHEALRILSNCTSCHSLVWKKLSSIYGLRSRKCVILLKSFTCVACVHYISKCQFLYMMQAIDLFCSQRRILRLCRRSHATKGKAIESMLRFLWTAWSLSSLAWIPTRVPVILPHLDPWAGLIASLRPQVPVDPRLTMTKPLLRFFRLTCSSLSIMGRCWRLKKMINVHFIHVLLSQ